MHMATNMDINIIHKRKTFWKVIWSNKINDDNGWKKKKGLDAGATCGIVIRVVILIAFRYPSRIILVIIIYFKKIEIKIIFYPSNKKKKVNRMYYGG